MKTCGKCGVEKAVTEFHRHRGRKDGLAQSCKPCANAWTSNYYKTNPEAATKRRQQKTDIQKKKPEKNREYQLKYMYNLTPDAVDAMLAAQGGRCANPGCRTDEPGERGWNVDHDHACCPGKKSCGTCVRSLLCTTCNTAEGLLGGSPERARGLAEYIESHSVVRKAA